MRSFEDEKKISIIYLTSDINDSEKISNNINPIYIGSGFFRILLFSFIRCEMVVMTLTDLGNHEIKRSPNCKSYVYVFHSLVSIHKCYTQKAFENYDIILSNGLYQKKELEYCEKLFNFNKKKIYNTGYPYLENLFKNKHQNINLQQKNKILFALSWSKNRNNLFDKHTERILKDLIAKNYDIVLRIHPETLKRSSKTIKNIENSLGNLKNFEINKNLMNLKPLNESSILITDNGGIALEYFIAQRKPVLYLNHTDKIHNELFYKINIPTLEDQFKNLIGITMQHDELDQIDFYIEKTKKKFDKKKYIIDELIKENQIVLKNQTQNAKKILLESLEEINY
tara:strand:- start:649 stop:1668 length:1020 start_codon:yes stop_codon:yes gene_type:complete